MGTEVSVIQSYRDHDIPDWISLCMESVQSFAESKAYVYRRFDDAAVEDILEEDFSKKVGGRWAMKTDLARLLFCQRLLAQGVKRVVWLDADVLVIDPKRFDLEFAVEHGFSFGREIWVEESGKVRRGVHNAFCLFEQNNPFLGFYIHACREMIRKHDGVNLAPHLLGPKFLKSQLPFMGDVLDFQVEMWSPWVITDTKLYSKQRQQEEGEPMAANLCHSMACEIDRVQFIRRVLSDSTAV